MLQNRKLYNIFSRLFFLLGVFLFVSCGSKKDIVYFQDVSSFETLVGQNTFVPKFKVDDEISIFVSTNVEKLIFR